MTQTTKSINIYPEERERILAEVQKLLYTYNLNRIIRCGQERKEEFETQSVAEHITNMMFLAHYFRDLEDPEHKMDFPKIIKMILMHDMPEIENGDIISLKKTKEHEDKDVEVLRTVADKSPKFVFDEIMILYPELEAQETPEAKFVYCIDKFEGHLFWFNEKGMIMMRNVLLKNNLPLEGNLDIYNKRMESMNKFGFKEMAKFLEVIHDEKKKMSLSDSVLQISQEK